MYVVDKHNKPVPVGVTGELCIAGMNVGQGYLNRPDLTAEKFIDNPFGEGELYKTGDLAYWREDGNIVFVGRSDFQVKINGQRIETAEIETVIASVVGVEAVVVLVRKNKERDVLVAFYSGEDVAESTIKETCRGKLPRYMVPSFVVHLDSMPLNQNGKLDRKVLAKTELIVPGTENDEPVNDTESFICRVFEEVLDEKGIGRNSDFFEMGGTSYSMISLLSEEGFENITAAEFMRNPTPALLASLLIENRFGEAEYLEELYVPENPEKVLIILPYAGGGAESFSNFVASLKRVRNDVALYFIRYLHSVAECEDAANEIARLFKGKKIFFYSHCLGSAVALQIISKLEKQSLPIERYFAAASIPPKKPREKNMWNYVPDSVLKSVLKKAGSELDRLVGSDVTAILKKFRKDTDFAFESFSKLHSSIETPVSLIMSKTDIFTRNYQQAETIWKRYADNVSSVSFIDTDSHYFQSKNSEELIENIFEL